MLAVRILLLNNKKKRKVGNHRKFERKGVINYLYFDKPIVIVNRNKKEIVVNDWYHIDKGVHRAIQAYLDSATVKYILKYMGYELVDLRGKSKPC